MLSRSSPSPTQSDWSSDSGRTVSPWPRRRRSRQHYHDRRQPIPQLSYCTTTGPKPEAMAAAAMVVAVRARAAAARARVAAARARAAAARAMVWRVGHSPRSQSPMHRWNILLRGRHHRNTHRTPCCTCSDKSLQRSASHSLRSRCQMHTGYTLSRGHHHRNTHQTPCCTCSNTVLAPRARPRRVVSRRRSASRPWSGCSLPTAWRHPERTRSSCLRCPIDKSR